MKVKNLLESYCQLQITKLPCFKKLHFLSWLLHIDSLHILTILQLQRNLFAQHWKWTVKKVLIESNTTVACLWATCSVKCILGIYLLKLKQNLEQCWGQLHYLLLTRKGLPDRSREASLIVDPWKLFSSRRSCTYPLPESLSKDLRIWVPKSGQTFQLAVICSSSTNRIRES